MGRARYGDHETAALNSMQSLRGLRSQAASRQFPPSYPGDKDAAEHLRTGFKSFVAPVHPAMVVNPNNREIGVGARAVNAYDLAPDDFIDYGSVS